MRIILTIFALLTSVSFCKAIDDKATARAELNNVTVYRLGAEMQQSFKVNLKTQTQYIEVSNVSSSLEKNSLQIKNSNSITILGFEFFNTYLSPEIKSPEFQKIEDSIEQTTKEIRKLNTNASTLRDLIQVLTSNREIKGSQTGLSVAELMKLMDYYKSKSTELKNEIAEIDAKTERLNEIKRKLLNQLDEERKNNTQKGGKLVIQIVCNVAGTYDFTINYLTQNASWVPFYDIKTQNITSPFDLIYKAKISQRTGIDWKQVKLKLSTALPDQSGNAPILKTWFLQYVNPVYKSEGFSSLLQGKAAGVQVTEASPDADQAISIRGSGSIRSDNQPLYIVNGNEISKEEFKNISPQAIKSVDVLKDNKATAIYGSRAANGVIVITLKDDLSDYVSVQDNSLNVVYDIDIPFDITTNGKDKVATLQTQKVDANYMFYSIPKLNDNVYLVAKVANWSKLNLLDGEANLFFENTYVGKTDILSTVVQDTFDLTIATDKRVLIKREKIKDYSSTQFLSSNKKEIFTYEITVKNNKSQTATVSVKDQYPISSNKEIEVELVDAGNAVVNAETGGLSWQTTLQPNEQKKIRFQYSVKYPKDKKLNL